MATVKDTNRLYRPTSNPDNLSVTFELDSDITPATPSTPIYSGDSVRAYLNGIGKHRLLTAQEEVEHSKAIEAGLMAVHKMTVTENPRLRRELNWIVAQGQTSKNIMLKSNLRLVVSVAKRYTNRGVSLLDLIQEGNLGLIRAVKKFDYLKGYKFSTYATWWIRQAITRAMIDQGRTIRIPAHTVEQIKRMNRARHELRALLEREPTNDEIAAEIDVKPERILELVTYDREPVSLDQTVGDDDTTSLGDLVAYMPNDGNDSESDSVTYALLRKQIQAALDSLPDRERGVLRLRFGLEDGRQRTLEEVSADFGLSRERVRQIEKGALARLRQPDFAGHLADYVALRQLFPARP